MSQAFPFQNLFIGSVLAKLTGILGLALLIDLSFLSAGVRAQTPGRWLDIRRIGGTVFYQAPAQQTAKIGDRLERPGQGVSTEDKSYSILLIDSDIGTVNMGENTQLLLKQAEITPNQGRVTVLSVPTGTARLKIRKFSNPESRLQIETPAGITGVRGTEFTVGVGYQGKTVLATKEGTVAATAQGETVLVEPGYGTSITPGEPPLVPQLLTNDLSLTRIRLFRTSLGTVEIKGRVDALNQVWVNGEPVAVDKEGKFKTILPMPLSRGLKIQVQSPFGQRAYYSLMIH